MTISSLPQDNEGIVEPFMDDLGNKTYIATQQFILFLNDLVAALNPVQAETSSGSQAYNEIENSIGRISADLRGQLKINQKFHGLIADLNDSIVSDRDKLIKISGILYRSLNQISEAQDQLSFLQSEQKQIANKLSNIANQMAETQSHLTTVDIEQKSLSDDIKRLENACQ